MALQPGEQTWGGWTVRVSEGPAAEDENTVVLAAEKVNVPLTIAAWDGTGRLAVENGSRTIKRLFDDRGIPVEKRGEHPALLLNGRPAAVFGVAADWALRPREGEKMCIVTLEKEDKKDDLLL